MILFVFEGDEREPRLYRTLERLYFPKVNDNIICSFGNNIYDLYNELKEYEDGGEIVSVMRERLAARGDSTLNGIRSSDIYRRRLSHIERRLYVYTQMPPSFIRTTYK